MLFFYPVLEYKGLRKPSELLGDSEWHNLTNNWLLSATPGLSLTVAHFY